MMWFSTVACGNCGYVDRFPFPGIDCGRMCPSCAKWHELQFISARFRWYSPLVCFRAFDWHWRRGCDISSSDDGEETHLTRLYAAIHRRYPLSRQVVV